MPEPVRDRSATQTRRLRRGLALVATAVAAGALLAALPYGEPSSRAAAPEALPVTEVAVLATPRSIDATSVEIRFERIDTSSRPSSSATSTPLGTIALPREGVARGDVVPGARAVVVVADGTAPRGPRARETDFAAVLYGADEAHGVTRLADGIVHASRPLASLDGAIYVERGVAGVDVSTGDGRAGRLRVDNLSVDAVDRASASIRAVYTWSGYALHIAGELDGELVVYRVGPGVAEIVAIDRATARSRVVAAVPPFARDFTLDGQARSLVMSNLDAHDATLWVVERVDLATGLRTRVMATRDEAAVPFALEGTGLAWATRSGGRGSTLPRGARLFAPAQTMELESLRAMANDGVWAMTAHEAADGSESLSAVHVATGTTVAIGKYGEARERLEALGFVGGTRRALR